MSAKNTGNHAGRVMKGGTDLGKLKQMEDFDWDEVRVRMP